MSAEKRAMPQPPIQVTESGREALKLYEREIATYLRELPREKSKAIYLPGDPQK